MNTLDRQTANHALLILANGDMYDVYGDNWAEIVEDADALAEHLGIAIDCFNSDLPED